MCPDRCVNRQPSLEGSVCQRGSSLAPSPPASVHSGSPGRWASESEDLCLRPSQVIRGSWGLPLGKAVDMSISPEGRTPSTNLCVLQSAAVSPAVTTHDVRGSPLAPGGKYV